MHSREKRGKVGKSGVVSYFPFLASSAVSCAALHIPYFGHNWGKKGRDASRMGSWEWEEAKIQQTEEGENRNLGMRQKLFVGNFPPFFRGEFRLEFTFFYRLNLKHMDKYTRKCTCTYALTSLTHIKCSNTYAAHLKIAHARTCRRRD